MAVSLKDIAQHVGVSVQVASKVLNGGSATVGASPQTRQRVLAMAHKLGYRRHAAGSALRRQSFRTVGLLMGGSEQEFFLPQGLLAGIARTLSPRDYVCTLVAAGSLNDAHEISRQRILSERLVDSLIIGYGQDPPPALLAAVKRLELPVVWLHRSTRFNAVAYDEGQATEMLVDHLADQGHRAITYVDYNGRRESAPAARDRLAAFAAACRRRRVQASVMNEHRVPRAQRAAFTWQWLGRSDHPTAVIVDNCSAAQVILDVALQHGVSIPDQLAVASFDNGAHASTNAPAITVAVMPEEQLGVMAACMSLDLAQSPEKNLPSRRIPATLQIGGSTVPAPGSQEPPHVP